MQSKQNFKSLAPHCINVKIIIFMKKTIFGRICSFAKVLTIFQHYLRKKTKLWIFFSIFKVLAPYTDFFSIYRNKATDTGVLPVQL